MKYKVGDRVRIGEFETNITDVKQWQGKVMTISTIIEFVENGYYEMLEDDGEFRWYENAIEGLAEPESKKPTMTDVFQLAIDTYGRDEQCRMINEEMAELTVALSKYHRNQSGDTWRRIQEEIADVCIMMEQAKLMFGEEDVNVIIANKTHRLYDRLKDDQTVEVVAGKHKINGKTYTWINPDGATVEVGSIAIADTEKGHMPIIVTNTWPEKLRDVKHHRKIICAGGLSE